jgi:hypothetical protein
MEKNVFGVVVLTRLQPKRNQILLTLRICLQGADSFLRSE